MEYSLKARQHRKKKRKKRKPPNKENRIQKKGYINMASLSLSQHPAVYHHHFYLFLYCVNYLHSALYRTYLLYFSY